MNSKTDLMKALLDWMNEDNSTYDPLNPYHASTYNQVDDETKSGIDWEAGMNSALKSLGRQSGNSGGATPAYAPRAALPSIPSGNARSEVLPAQQFDGFDGPGTLLWEVLRWASRR